MEFESTGKKYNGEKAIISLTSWTERINEVPKTLFSIVKNCPGFHIVLTLSKQEFPAKAKNLPESLKTFIDNNLIEVLWVDGNIMSHKKYFYTMQKYRDLPIILADDDLTYVANFAEILYRVWLEHKKAIISCRAHYIRFIGKQVLPYRCWDYQTKKQTGKCLFFTTGQGSIFPPDCLHISDDLLPDIQNTITADDVLLNVLAIKYNIEKINLAKFFFIERKENIKTGLARFNTCGQNLNDVYINKYNEYFNKVNPL